MRHIKIKCVSIWLPKQSNKNILFRPLCYKNTREVYIYEFGPKRELKIFPSFFFKQYNYFYYMVYII